MEDFDKKIEQTLSCLDGLKHVEMPLDLEQKIKQRIERQQVKSARIIPFRTVLLAAAVFSGIVILNVITLISEQVYQKNGFGNGRQKVGVQAFASTYFNNSEIDY